MFDRRLPLLGNRSLQETDPSSRCVAGGETSGKSRDLEVKGCVKERDNVQCDTQDISEYGALMELEDEHKQQLETWENAHVQQGETFGPAFPLWGSQVDTHPAGLGYQQFEGQALSQGSHQLSLNLYWSIENPWCSFIGLLEPTVQSSRNPAVRMVPIHHSCVRFAAQRKKRRSHQRSADQELAGIAGKHACLAGRNVVHAPGGRRHRRRFPRSRCNSTCHSPCRLFPIRSHFRSKPSRHGSLVRVGFCAQLAQQLECEMMREDCRPPNSVSKSLCTGSSAAVFNILVVPTF